MILQSLALTNFKNIASATLDFSPKINCLLGDNGMGKSNLLDAIHYLSFTRSYNRAPEAMLIKRGEDYAIARGNYMRGDTPEEITAALRRGARRSLRRGGKEYKRISAHIGLLPAVMIAPPDLALVTESGEERRRFADMIISQGDARYLDAAMRYNQLLDSRNRLLRDGLTDPTLFESIELMMDASAAIIVDARRKFVERLGEIFSPVYASIAGTGETPALTYTVSGGEYPTLLDALQNVRTRDMALRHTTVGPHRDDIMFTLDDMPVKLTASQGQTKTFTIALRLAQYRFLAEATGLRPLLLLDDIFDKLDATRVERIMEIVTHDGFGQIFITDTNRAHLDEIMKRTSGDYRMWNVCNGTFKQLKE